MNNVNETYSISSLSKDEVKIILESLLFSSSVDVCASFHKEESLAMFDLATKIRTMFPTIPLDDINITPIYDEENNIIYHDEHTGDIVKMFPEVFQENPLQP
jgi:hypothetical protein